MDSTDQSNNDSAEDAIIDYNAVAPEMIRIYTDGSSMDGYIGAAAVMPQAEGAHTRRMEYMGTLQPDNFYSAEL